MVIATVYVQIFLGGFASFDTGRKLLILPEKHILLDAIYILVFEWVVGVCSCGGFLFLFYWFAGILKMKGFQKTPRPTILELSNKMVSGVHGCMASFCGYIIVQNTDWDVLFARHWLASVYIWVAVGYGVYDIWSMGYVYVQRNQALVSHSGYLAAVKSFILGRPLMLGHHVGMLLVTFPAAAWYRKGRGDFFLGCFFLTELSTPFVSFRAILSELDMKTSWLYHLNGGLMILVFVVCRILVFPFMFHRYASYAGLDSWLSAFVVVPKKCVVCSCCILAFQVYWLCLMLSGAKKILLDKSYSGVDEKPRPVKLSQS